MDICHMEESFIISPPLEDGEKDRYENPALSERKATVLRHAIAALDCVIERGFGPHGLPFMGSGDWNDGMDKVVGESVWLGWFFSCCAHDFAMLMQALGEAGFEKYEAIAEKVGRAADACHNGSWYLRAFYPDGSALGDKDRIDSISQSWAALCPWSSREKLMRSVISAMDALHDRQHGIIKLMNPAYSPDGRSPGYISSYGEGFRENGGQYSHGAIWLALAAIKLGMKDEAWEMLSSMLPENHRSDVYKAEPYVLAADVCSAKGREGLAGWTWYTGSAGWFFHVVSSEIFGLKLSRGRLYIRPALPSSLTGFELKWTSPKGKVFHILCRDDEISVNGKAYKGEGLEI
jgi:cyclic beta-1,2-glucan synthetase